jgi:hypothetical protein
MRENRGFYPILTADMRKKVAWIFVALRRHRRRQSQGELARRACRPGGGRPRRLFYAILFPLVLPIRLKRMLEHYNTAKKRRDPRFIPALLLILLGLGCHAFGEAIGYVFGSGRIGETYTEDKFRHQEYVLTRERREIFGLET